MGRKKTNLLWGLMLVGLAGCAAQATPPPPTAFSYYPTVAFFEEGQGETPAQAAGASTVTLEVTPTPVTPTQTNTPQTESTGIAIATAAPITDTPTQTDTPTATNTLNVTLTPSPSITFTPTRTPTVTNTPAPTERQLSGLEQLAESARNATILPPDFTVGGTPVVPTVGTFVPGGTPSDLVDIFTFLDITPPAPSGSSTGAAGGFSSAANCAGTAPGGFANLELADPSVRGLIGCPTGAPPQARTVTGAYQTFQSGFMLWVDGLSTIYTASADGTLTSYPDTWNAATDPESTGQTPPADNLAEPGRGFGKVWRENPGVAERLGWATGPERGDVVTFVVYERGLLVYAPQRGDVLALSDDGQWKGYAGSF